MKKDKDAGAAGLRREAEDRVKASAAERGSRASEDERRLLHELEVHQVELELQNDELRAARLATEASLERYTLLFDFAPLGYTILAADGTIRDVNHVGASLLGQPRAQLVGRPFDVFLSSDDRVTFSLLLIKTLERETKETCEVMLTKRGQIPLAAQLTARALTRGERMVLLAFEDITERRHREQERERTERALRELDRRKDEFMAALSHELRNPLAPIQNSLFLLSHSEPGDEKAAKARAIMERQVGLLSRVVDDLLDTARIARGKIQLEHELIDLERLVLRTLEDHHLSFDTNGVRLETRFEPGPFWVDGDAARLSQALNNLIGNAEKFTPRGGSVVVGLARDEHDEVALRVRDTGAGIDPDMLPHVFESFVQAPQTLERARGGLGLGLATVKGLVELHGGTVAVASDGPGRGTEVTIRLPLADAPVREAASHGGERHRNNRRVLVIDDNADNADSMQFALELGGHEVQIALDGPTGLELARRFRPEVVISDIGLPEMDGYAIARAIRADAALKDTYLIAVSGYTGPEDLERADAAGFNRHLGKPVRFEQLDRLVSEAPGPRSEPSPPAPPHSSLLH